MRLDLLLRLALLPWLAVAHAAPQTVEAPDLAAEGTAFVLKLPTGKVLRGAQLQGAVLQLAVEGGAVAPMRIAKVTPDPADPAILRHQFEQQGADGRWQPACTPNFQGETWGFPIALPEGHPGREGAITLTCASGAVGKCVRFGYQPWARGPHGEDLLPYHAACVHLVRADYAGDGTPHTKDGTDIDVYDRLGIQKPESKADKAFAFEAGWAPAGAVCVARTRWADVITTEALWQAAPRLHRRCDEAAARKLGALLYNRSRR